MWAQRFERFHMPGPSLGLTWPILLMVLYNECCDSYYIVENSNWEKRSVLSAGPHEENSCFKLTQWGCFKLYLTGALLLGNIFWSNQAACFPPHGTQETPTWALKVFIAITYFVISGGSYGMWIGLQRIAGSTTQWPCPLQILLFFMLCVLGAESLCVHIEIYLACSLKGCGREVGVLFWHR